MTSIITRSGKGSALTHPEMDSNLDSLNGINEAQTGTSYTVVAADQNRTIEFSNAATITVTLTLIATILASSDTSNFKVIIKNIGVGQVDIVPTTDTFDDGDTTKTINQFEWICIETDNAGTSWNVINLGFVTGIGGGLDADTVDGSHASDLLARANHTGTQAPSTITALTASSAELNRTSVSLLGTTESSKVVTTDANNNIIHEQSSTTISGADVSIIQLSGLVFPADKTIQADFHILQNASGGVQAELGFNGDTLASNYFSSSSLDGGAVTKAQNNFMNVPWSGDHDLFFRVIISPDSVNGRTIATVEGAIYERSVGSAFIYLGTFVWNNGSAITSIEIQDSIGGGSVPIAAGSRLTVKMI